MITITTTDCIEPAFEKFKSLSGAYAICRVLPGQWEQANCQEWAERGTIEGVPAKVTYLFENSEAESDDGGDIPFDAAHITKIEIAEKDEDGEYESI